MKKRAFLTAIFCWVVFAIFAQNKREMRMVWIATVNNIDWPPKYSFSTYIQQNKIVEMLDTFKLLNINAIIFQVRPTSDAFYKSPIEQWSRFLTGEQGKEPYPYYDPLDFITEEAHKRNIDVHAWINPYRLLNSDNINLLNSDNLFFNKPDLFIKYGNQYFFNPAKDETLTHLRKVVYDIVSRYDIDAIHIDDYFYPYPVAGEPFPDNADFEANNRGFNNKNDWRRDNVNRAIDIIHTTIKEIKPYVEFGVSPFGVWRNKSRDPKGSNTRAMSNYDDLYADVLKWIDEEKIDYVIPQLYWEIGHRAAEYETLAEWWNDNCKNTNLYIGQYASNLGNKSAATAWQNGNEICRQMVANKKYQNIKGIGIYSAVALMENRQGICDSLKNNFLKYPALIPQNRHNISSSPEKPYNAIINFEPYNQKIYLQWEHDNPQNIKYYVIYLFDKDKDIETENPKNIFATTREQYLDITDFIMTNYDKHFKFVISAVSRYNVESQSFALLNY